MNDTIIGGAIAALIGAIGYAIVGLWLERRREKAKKIAMVDALIIETSENHAICKGFQEHELWWMTSFKLEAYDTYKGKLFLLQLSEDVPVKLVKTALTMKDFNTSAQVLQQAAASGQGLPTETASTPKELLEQLEFVNKELRKWKEKNTRSLAFRIRCRFRKFAKIRN